jgi:phage terminase large subunit
MKPYRPRGAAKALFTCKDPDVLIDGGAGTGKSIALLSKAYLVAEKYPGARILLVRKTRKSMTESVLVTWESKVVPTSHPCLQGASRRIRQSYDFPNGSSIVLGGMDSEHEAAVMSTDYDMILVFEATELSESDFENLTTRLRNGVVPYQQIIVDCNPSHDKHWLKRRADAGRMTRLISRHEDNPLLYEDDGTVTAAGRNYLSKLEHLTGARRKRLLEGRWVAAEGVVYEEFDESLHVIDPFAIPKDWRRIRSIDFGFTNPFVAHWYAIDPDGRMYLYREVYGTKRIVSDWANQYIKPLSDGESFEATVSDHDAEDRATLEREGISTTAAHKAISPGIEAVAARLRKAGDGKPRLFIFRDCLMHRDPVLDDAKLPCSILEEFDAYVWPKTMDGKANKEVPVKDNDHAMDTLRYSVAYVDQLGTQPLCVVGIGGVSADRHRDLFDDELWEEA